MLTYTIKSFTSAHVAEQGIILIYVYIPLNMFIAHVTIILNISSNQKVHIWDYIT